MSLKDRLGDDIKAAMKARDKVRLEAVRGIKKALLEKEIELRAEGKDALSETDELELLTKQAKQRRDSIAQYSQAGRDDLVQQETQELEVIETYLPQQLSDNEIAAAVDAAIAKAGASTAKDLGKVMGPLVKELKGRADGQKIQALVKAKLGG
ncbi:hypothetical protein KR51_00034980 [Rubidibacter lacunae KORDI 51-2]|uniref:GatB/YqeY domain-containing protein n=1 Tax=Rubidibacter lacunae KORDI 51-2 TaxID=582515 RepID=U5DEG6_9CHRO|nr:GatB/YqeY domain-containing protein [Rubidibacter lacunae]ERN40011.1 hypothetical protein KR51_00034980 [Rubidibacter lacunae KORDI 51-2]